METFEDAIAPNRNKLIIDKEGAGSATIIDAELDPLECEFHYDDAVKINAEEYSHIYLTVENLEMLIEMIHEHEQITKNL